MMQPDDRKYLEQTAPITNPKPNRRKKGLEALEVWPIGTRWVLDGIGLYPYGSYGHYLDLPKVTQLEIVGKCVEVTPGFRCIRASGFGHTHHRPTD
jgi:hypothetical protein